MTTIERLKHLRASMLGYHDFDEERVALTEAISWGEAEAERQKPCDACKNGTNGGKFTIDIKFGQRIHLNYHYCPTCGRQLIPPPPQETKGETE